MAILKNDFDEKCKYDVTVSIQGDSYVNKNHQQNSESSVTVSDIYVFHLF